MRDVQSFLKQKHQAAGYCVYNLCTEEHFAYKPSKFEMVANFPFDDHQVCSFSPVSIRPQDGAAAIGCGILLWRLTQASLKGLQKVLRSLKTVL